MKLKLLFTLILFAPLVYSQSTKEYKTSMTYTFDNGIIKGFVGLPKTPPDCILSSEDGTLKAVVNVTTSYALIQHFMGNTSAPSIVFKQPYVEFRIKATEAHTAKNMTVSFKTKNGSIPSQSYKITKANTYETKFFNLTGRTTDTVHSEIQYNMQTGTFNIDYIYYGDAAVPPIPTISQISNQYVKENGGLQTITLSNIDIPNRILERLGISAQAKTGGILQNIAIKNIDFLTKSATLEYAPLAGQAGKSDSIIVTLTDSIRSTVKKMAFKVSVVSNTTVLRALTVNGGSGTGNYPAQEIVAISAIAPVGKIFDKWTGDISAIANINSSATTLTMPDATASVTATFKDAPVTYLLTVNSGTGTGSYVQGAVVNITANPAPANKKFDKWTGQTTGIANINAASTTITMPGSVVAVTATYTDISQTYTLNVMEGNGGGTYSPGTMVDISANIPAGKEFVKWTGDIAGIADVNSAVTKLTMPSQNVAITATFKSVSINDNSSIIQIYPNPTNGIIWLKGTESGEIKLVKVYNISGELIYEIANIKQDYFIDLASLTQGIYILDITLNNEKQIKVKIVKQ